jgi:hypothetical protein
MRAARNSHHAVRRRILIFEQLPIPPRTKRYKCQVERLLDRLEPKDKEILIDAIADPRWSSTALLIEIRARGLSIGQNHFYIHRRKECPCWRISSQLQE